MRFFLRAPHAPFDAPWRCRQSAAIQAIFFAVLAITLAADVAAQDGYVQPTGYGGAPVVTAGPSGPSWEEFGALADRLRVTEERLQTLYGNANVDPNANVSSVNSYYQNQPYGTPSLAAETQTPETSLLSSRIAALEQSAQTAASRLPTVKMTGFAQLDEGFFGQDAASRANLGDIQDGLGFRRARLQAVGNLSEFTRYSLEFDFAVAGRPSFLDVWGEQTNVPFFGNIRIGQFRQPTTMDGWTSIRHLEFMERSLPFQALDPFRRVGMMSWFNAGEDDRTLIAYSVYGTGFTFTNPGATSPVAGTLGDTRFATQIGDNGGVSAALRGSHLLYWDPYAGDRYLLHIGGGYNFSEIGGSPGTGSNARTYQARAIPEFFVGDPGGGGLTANGTPFVADSGRFLANDFQFMHAELAGNYGSAHFQSEFMATLVDRPGAGQVYYHGAYVQAGYFLTGENCGYNKQMGALDYNVKPFQEFFGLGRDQWFCGWGAWEIAARYSYVNLNAAVAPVAAPAVGPPPSPNPGIVNDATLALNWWWNQYTRVQFNYIYVNANPLAAATGITNIYAARFQFEF
jgi:phosphate-selective porin OprO/OprP